MTEQIPPEKLGEFLKRKREEKGITFEQLAAATRINVRLLRALEADQFKELPAKPFVRGFVISYARFVGLDPKEVLLRYDPYIDQESQKSPQADENKYGHLEEGTESDGSRTFLGLLLGAFVVIGVITTIILKPHFLKSRNTHQIQKLQAARKNSPGTALSSSLSSAESILSSLASSSATPEPSPTLKPTPTPKPTPTATPEATPSDHPSESPVPTPAADLDPLNSGKNLELKEVKHRIVFKAAHDTWIRYRIDNKRQMSFVLKKNRYLVLKAKTALRFQSSNPDTVLFAVGKDEFKPLSAHPQYRQQENGASIYAPREISEKPADNFSKDPALIEINRNDSP